MKDASHLYEVERRDRGKTSAVRAGRPDLVTNGGETSAIFLVLQGMASTTTSR
jgi:hypothetical protein